MTLAPTLSLPTSTPALEEPPSPLPASTDAAEPASGTEPAVDLPAQNIPMPEGTPAAEWIGLPVMPGAVAGQGDNEGYFFSTRSSLEEVRAYYEETLTEAGWNLLAEQEGKSNSRLLFFEKGDESANIAIIDDRRPDQLILVLLIR